MPIPLPKPTTSNSPLAINSRWTSGPTPPDQTHHYHQTSAPHFSAGSPLTDHSGENPSRSATLPITHDAGAICPFRRHSKPPRSSAAPESHFHYGTSTTIDAVKPKDAAAAAALCKKPYDTAKFASISGQNARPLSVIGVEHRPRLKSSASLPASFAPILPDGEGGREGQSLYRSLPARRRRIEAAPSMAGTGTAARRLATLSKSMVVAKGPSSIASAGLRVSTEAVKPPSSSAFHFQRSSAAMQTPQVAQHGVPQQRNRTFIEQHVEAYDAATTFPLLDPLSVLLASTPPVTMSDTMSAMQSQMSNFWSTLTGSLSDTSVPIPVAAEPSAEIESLARIKEEQDNDFPTPYTYAVNSPRGEKSRDGLASLELVSSAPPTPRGGGVTNVPDIGFSFSPAGLLLPYHLGVVACLEHFGYLEDHVPIAGASAGALAVAIVTGKISAAEAMKVIYRVQANIRKYGTARRLHNVLDAELDNLLPENAHELVARRPGKSTIAYTHLVPKLGLVPILKGQFVSSFTSKADYKECLIASCNIPFYFSKLPWVNCRGRWSIDGYFSATTQFGCPKTGAARDIRVIPFSVNAAIFSFREGDVISPALQKFDHLLEDSPMGNVLLGLKDYLESCPAPTAAEALAEESENELPKGGTRQSIGHKASAEAAVKITEKVVNLDKGEHDAVAEEGRRRAQSGDAGSARFHGDSKPDKSRSSSRETQRSSGSGEPVSRDTSDRQQINKNMEDSVAEFSDTSEAFSSSKSHSKGAPEKKSSKSMAQSQAANSSRAPFDVTVLTLPPVLRFGVTEMLKLALDYTDDAVVAELFDVGRADAYRWMQHEMLRRLDRPTGGRSFKKSKHGKVPNLSKIMKWKTLHKPKAPGS